MRPAKHSYRRLTTQMPVEVQQYAHSTVNRSSEGDRKFFTDRVECFDYG